MALAQEYGQRQAADSRGRRDLDEEEQRPKNDALPAQGRTLWERLMGDTPEHEHTDVPSLRSILAEMSTDIELLPDPTSTQFDWAHNLVAAEASRVRQLYTHAVNRFNDDKPLFLLQLTNMVRALRRIDGTGSDYEGPLSRLKPLGEQALKLATESSG